MQDLISNKKYFDANIKIAESLYNNGLYNDCALFIQKLGLFAWQNFTGYYTSYKLECLLLKINNSIQPTLITKDYPQLINNDKKKILHVVTEIYATGGHSKLVNSWMEIDDGNYHAIVASKMKFEDLHDICNFYDTLRTIDKFQLQGKDILEKSSYLLHLAQNFDVVVLHIHPNDVVPILSFGNKKYAKPIFFLNHAEHTFWFGITIADYVIQIKESNVVVDAHRRQNPNQFYLPLPIGNKMLDGHKLQKPQDKFIILSTGSEFKYKPNNTCNFFKEAFLIVERYPNVIIYIAGVSSSYSYYQPFQHDRIICLGLVTDLNQYEALADLYLEGFPTPSFTALLQAAMNRVPFVLQYNPMPVYQLFENNEDVGTVYPKNIEEWRHVVYSLIEDTEKREIVATKQFNYIKETYSEENIKSKIKQIYELPTNMRGGEDFSYIMDKWYFDENEKEILNLYDLKINHLEFTWNLSFINKYRVVMQGIVHKNANVEFDFKWKNLLIYMFS